MAVRQSTFGRQMDKNMPGKSLQDQMKRATALASTKTQEDKFHQPSLADRAILALLKLKKRDLRKQGSAPITTTRTTRVTSGLKQAGLSEKEIARFRGKK